MKNFKLKAMLLLAVLLCSGISALADTAIWQDSVRYGLCDDLTAYVIGANNEITTANIPEKITYEKKDYTVTSIRGCAFDGCRSLASVVIPSSVTSIGYRAFYGCSSLFAYHYKKDGTATLLKAGSETAEISGKDTYNIPEKVTHDGAEYTVTSIGDCAFDGCRSLSSVVIPSSVTSIGGYAFKGCSSLTSVVIPSSVTSIGNRAFYGCSSLASVVIPSSVTRIGSYAFSGCSSLASVVIPSSVTSIGSDAFSGCSSLASVVIPSSVTSIGEGTFSYCTGLVSVDIPYSVTSIGDGAFRACNNLKKLVCHATTPPVFADELWGGAFVGVNKDACTLYVPQESLDAYKSAVQWKDFFNITTGIKNVPNTSSSATESARYSTDGTRLASPQKGINIIRMSDGTVKKVLVK